MKITFFTVLAFCITNQLESQQFIPIKMDSLHSWAWMDDLEDDPKIYEYYSAYSYDQKDSLIQLRNNNTAFTHDSLIQLRDESTRYNYSYAQDTIFMFSEVLNSSNEWIPFSRSATIFSNNKIFLKLTENYINQTWVNSARHSYHYDAKGLDSLYLLEHWKNDGWENFYKKETGHDVNGNMTSVDEYYADAAGDLKFNRGDLYEYDQFQHRIQHIHINNTPNGPALTSRMNLYYGNDALLDSMSRCRYINNGLDCENIIKTKYDYFPSDATTEYVYTWIEDKWAYTGKEIEYDGPQIYSARPDSIVFYSYSDVSSSHFPSTRKYYTYEDLGNNTIYFRYTEHNLEFNGEWRLIRLVEEWYHLQNLVSTEDEFPSTTGFDMFPNPVSGGQEIRIERQGSFTGTSEVTIFDMQGRLITSQMLKNGSSFKAPQGKGMYTILLKEGIQFTGVCKLIVSD